MKAVIQAGGKGARLRPFTTVLPKPLMPVGEMPVIEMLLKWIRRNGIRDTYITIGYLGHIIKSFCGDGRQWDMSISYSEEREPLGTVGPLTLLGKERLSETFVMLNGDLITDLNMREFVRSHKQSGCLVSVAVINREVNTHLGVIDCEGDRIVGFREKPVMRFKASMGIYCMEPGVLDLVPLGVPFGFDDLMYLMLEERLEINAFEHSGLWLDIGQHDDYIAAQQLVSDNQNALLGI